MSLMESIDQVRLPRLRSQAHQADHSSNSPKVYHSFLTSPTEKPVMHRAISDIPKIKKKSRRLQDKFTQLLAMEPPRQHQQQFNSQQQRMRHYMIENDDVQHEDLKPHELVGSQAVQNYYKHYKKLTKIVQQNKLNHIANSAFTAILENSQKFNVLPACYGMVRNEGERNVLKLGNYKLGDKYSQVLSSGLKEMKDVDEYLLSRNRLTDKGFNEVLSSINQDVVKLDFSNNKILSINTDLMKLLTNIDSRLQHLNLENNKLGDTAMASLSLAASCSRSLRYLNIRRNFLTRQSCENLSMVVEKAKHLEELYLGWNKFNGPSSKLIFQKLAKNMSILGLDYSNNGLGQTPSIIQAVCQFFTKNSKLVHLDLSYNNFCLTDSRQISEALRDNHSIYGMHFGGNCGYVNHEGFILFDEQQEAYQTIPSHQINGLEVCTKRTYARSDFSIQREVCWLCEGWIQHTIQLPEGVVVGENIGIHYSFDGFRKRQYTVKVGQNKIHVMLPPAEVRMYYTLNDTSHVFNEHPSQTVSIREMKSKPEATGNCLDLEVNIIKSQGHRIVTGEEYKQIRTPIIPRSDSKKAKQVKKWHYSDSVWAKEWKGEDSECTKRCFEMDWSHSKILNLVKNVQDQQHAKQILYENYKKIKQIYRHYSAWNPFGDIWAISMNPFTEFCNQAKIICKQLPSKIVDLTFITTNSISGTDWKGNHQVPERGLIRFQFMEALVRLADEKYRKSGIHEQMSECINSLINDHLKPIYFKFTSESWRHQTYFTEQIDTLIKNYRPVFKQLYRKNSKLKVRPGDKPFMCLDQFKDICQRVGMFVSGYAVERDCLINFNCSIMTQVDEVNNERIYRMTEIEFIEALTRMSQMFKYNKFSNSGERNELHYKFQQLILQLIQRVCSEDIRSQFPPPEKSMFDIDLEQS